MRELEPLSVNLEELAHAWKDESELTAYYVDTETGSVVMVHSEFDDLNELKVEIELQPNRYLYVPRSGKRQLDLDLHDFIYSVPDEAVRAQLNVALDAPDKFHSCRHILGKHEGLLARWEAWLHLNARQRAVRWLASLGYVSDLA